MKRALRLLFPLILISLAPAIASAQSSPPALCKPCLFYGGDLNESNEYRAALENANTLIVPDTSTYGSITIPSNHVVLVDGMLFQIQIDGNNMLDPDEVSWAILSGVSEANGGTVIASGEKFNPAMEPTGRASQGTEFTIAIALNPPVMLTGGEYWFNITPFCTNKKDQSCMMNQYWVSNTDQTNSFRGYLQPVHEMYVNSEVLGYDWENWCDLWNKYTCAYLSFGLMGKVIQ